MGCDTRVIIIIIKRECAHLCVPESLGHDDVLPVCVSVCVNVSVSYTRI